MSFVVGQKVRYLPQPEWGVGHVVALEPEGTRAQVLFPGREGDEPVTVSLKGGALIASPMQSGDTFRTLKGRRGVVTGEEPGARGLRRFVVRFDDGEEDELPESELHALAPRPDMLSLMREGQVGDARAFLLRKQALVLDDERRCDALGALLASRVMVKPHQVGVVQRVLAARRPRFILADEVGLGKTIEAGMVYSALRLSGLARRVLVVAPSHLSVQWLVELFHKFNQLFTLMDGERHESSLKEQPEVNPWRRFDAVITSLELLSRSAEMRQGAAEAGWDLVIIDEAHHLKGEKAFLAAEALAAKTWGLLLLTATPMQLDPGEYRGLLTLIDADTAPTEAQLLERLARQEELSGAVRALLEGKNTKAAVAALAKRFPEDQRLAEEQDPEALLGYLSETYSLSDALVRNRRAVVGGFSSRRLHRHRVELTEKELQAREVALDAARKSGLKGAPLANLLRRLESSPAAFLDAARSLENVPALTGRDAKFNAFLEVLREVWTQEPGAKVLVFTEARATLEWIRDELRKENLEALGYHGDLPMVERDRQVARFRDPEGPKILICTEVGGEGRNFQFAHHLVHYDLPWSPSTVEQRIGRLDRIGQTRTVELHVFELPGTLSHDVLTLLDDAVGVFGETVGGLDAVLEEVEPNLSRLALLSVEERAAYRETLAARVSEARAQVKRAYDPLLDLRSFDRPQVQALVTRAQERMGIDDEEEASLEEGLWALSRDLDERLEEAVTELAKRVGIGVDTDEQVEAFQCALTFGHALNVEALPGFNILEDKTLLGSFWRDTAVEQEEIEYFATGHPVVEALFGFLKDGPYGRSGFRFLEKRGLPPTRGIEFLFHAHPPEPADTSPGARVPSRQLSRFVDRLLIPIAVVEGPGGKPTVDARVQRPLEAEGQALKGDEVRAAFPTLAAFIDPAVAEATRAARRELERRAEEARERIEAERELTLQRLERSLTHQGISPELIRTKLEEERAHHASLLEALGGMKVELDSVCAFAINREKR